VNVETTSNIGDIYNQAIRYLSYREYAVGELRAKLLKKFDSKLGITQVLERLLTEDLLSEQRYAESYLRARVNKGYGPEYIRNELISRGLKKTLIDKVLQNSDIVWEEEVYKVWNKKFKATQLDEIQDKARQWRFLQYRGFSHDQIKVLFSRVN